MRLNYDMDDLLYKNILSHYLELHLHEPNNHQFFVNFLVLNDN